MLYDMIYLLTAVGLTPSGSSTVHIYMQTIPGTTQSTQAIHRTTQLTNWKECRPCHVFASYTLAFALQLRKNHGKTSVRVTERRSADQHEVSSTGSVPDLRWWRVEMAARLCQECWVSIDWVRRHLLRCQGCSQSLDWMGRHILVSFTGLGEETSAHLGLGSVIEDHSRYPTELRPKNDVFSETLCSF